MGGSGPQLKVGGPVSPQPVARAGPPRCCAARGARARLSAARGANRSTESALFPPSLAGRQPRELRALPPPYRPHRVADLPRAAPQRRTRTHATHRHPGPQRRRRGTVLPGDGARGVPGVWARTSIPRSRSRSCRWAPTLERVRAERPAGRAGAPGPHGSAAGGRGLRFLRVSRQHRAHRARAAAASRCRCRACTSPRSWRERAKADGRRAWPAGHEVDDGRAGLSRRVCAPRHRPCAPRRRRSRAGGRCHLRRADPGPAGRRSRAEYVRIIDGLRREAAMPWR